MKLCWFSVALAVIACDPQLIQPQGNPGGADGGAGSGGAGGGGGYGGGGGATTDASPSCGAQQFALTAPPPPNMLLVLDKSGSMGQLVTSDNHTKWYDIQQAMAQLMMQDQAIRFGMMTFPSDNDCGSGMVQVGVGPGNGAAVNLLLSMVSPGGNTPTAVSLQAAGAYQGLHDTTRANFVLLATDGLPNCGADDGPTVAAVQSLAAMGIKTFVIGFGADTQANPQLLDDMATAGGTARATEPKYYQANNLSDLEMAIQSIAGSVISCTYRLDRAPPDANQLYVAFDGVLVNQDAMNGWTYDASGPALDFHGSACDRLRSGMVMNVAVQYGCPPVQ